ncbi:MAG: hypothetical protein RBT63_05210 [Bdellovibrionales bacterium]|jgi:hypothetical protein|nr:hypothetical protein [Bdellovibrionales bacterium]
MTLEVTLLLGMFVFILGGAFFGESGPMKVFQNSGPRLGARIEKHVATGRGFTKPGEGVNRWTAPDSPPPTGDL